MNRDSLQDLDWSKLWKTELDVDGDGILSDNELLTLVSMAIGKEPTMTQVTLRAMLPFRSGGMLRCSTWWCGVVRAATLPCSSWWYGALRAATLPCSSW